MKNAGRTRPPRPRRVPRQERSRATVEAILQAASRVLAREGYEGTTTNKVAAVSGYGVGSLYDYFPNKDSLVAALIERHAREMAAVVETNFGPAAEAPLPVAVRSWIEGAANAHLANPDLNRVLVGQIPRMAELGVLQEVEDRIAYLVRLYLERRVDGVRPDDPPLAGFVVAQAVMSLSHKAVTTKPEAFADGRLVEETTNLVLGYLAPPVR